MQQFFLETLILLLALFGICVTIFQMVTYKKERKLYYKIIKFKNSQGKNVEIIINADDYDYKMEEIIENALSTYYTQINI